MDDAELVDRIRDGDKLAWEQLVERHSPLLWRLARRTVSDDAAASDAMQTAWLRLLQHVDRISEPAAVRSWLCTTVRREAIALSKASRRQAPTDPQGWTFDAPADPKHEPAERSVTAERNKTVLSALGGLSEKCRQLLTLHAHKVAYDEISTVMGMAVGSIGPTKARCLENMRRLPAIAKLEASI